MYLNVNPSKLVKEVISMLYWSMLAACTVGPGTVVTCARAGAEFELSLIYVLIFASVLAYTLQEGTARLTINSGLSLGQCLRTKYEHTFKMYNTAMICWVVAVSVSLGNTLYECNNFAGGVDAILSFPGAKDLDETGQTALRIGGCFAYAAIVLALLYKDKTNVLGVFLGIIMMGMVTLFLTVVFIMGFSWEKFLYGLIPNYPEQNEGGVEPADIIISLVGTTSIGFNLFLGGAMAKGRSLGSAQRGIAFSTISAFVVSCLILIVGGGYHDDPDRNPNFSITDLGAFIEKFVGRAGVIVYSLGFISAALSSMLTVPLGAALTADSVFSDDPKEANDVEADETSADKYTINSDKIPVPTSPSKVPMTPERSEKISIPPSSPEKKLLPLSPVSLHASELGVHGSDGDSNCTMGDQGAQVQTVSNIKLSSSQPAELGLSMEPAAEEPQKLPKLVYLGIMFGMVIISVIVISANADRTYVILVAQVFNGCLLPFFSSCLLLCLNDAQFMKASPQPLWANLFLVISVMITMFLANNAILSEIFGKLLEKHVSDPTTVRLGVAAGAAIIEIFLMGICTSLGRDLWRSFRHSKVSKICYGEVQETNEGTSGDVKLSKV